MRIIRVRKEIDFDNITLNSSLEKYQLEVNHPNIINGFMRFSFSHSFYSAIQKHVSETNIKYKFTSKGQIILESKESMKKRGLPSPDVFDSLCLTFATKEEAQVFHTQPSELAKPYFEELGL